MPFVDVVGNGANAAPEQMGATAVKAGVIWLAITMSMVAVVPH